MSKDQGGFDYPDLSDNDEQEPRAEEYRAEGIPQC